MTLANVAALLARWGQRVLIIDWDLEAPGIEKFFERGLIGSRRATSGLVELMATYDAAPLCSAIIRAADALLSKPRQRGSTLA